MYNINPLELIISEPKNIGGENIHKVIGFHIETGEELVLFRGTWDECRNFICSIEVTALAQLRHYHKLMDEFVNLERQIDILEDELRGQECAYDRLLTDYDELDDKYQAEVAKNNDVSLCCTGQIDNGLLFKMATGKTSRCDAIQLLVQLFGMDFNEARRYVHKIMVEG